MLILLDRDGVLNEDRDDYVKSPGEWLPIAGSAEAVARFNAQGWPVAICTNQAVIGKGIIPEEMLMRIHDRLRDHLARHGAKVDLILFAPDPPWAVTERRKPGPGMLREAMAHFRHGPSDTVFIGDNLRDLEAGAAAGCRRILVRTGHGAGTQAKGLPGHVQPVEVYADLSAAAEALIGTRNAA